MMKITDSMEWVYHDRGTVESSLVRKYQEECWKQLIGSRKLGDFIYELNTRWFPDGKQVILINPKDPVDMIHQMRLLLAGSNYDIKLTTREEETEPTLSSVTR